MADSIAAGGADSKSGLCLIFDMDGTLVDSEPCGAQAIKELLPDLSLTVHEIVARFRGVRNADVLAQLKLEYGISIPENFDRLFRQREAELAHELIKPNPGVAETLAKLPHHACIASNAPRAKTQRSLDICDLAHFFDGRIYSAYELNAWKPDPALFLHAAQSEGFTPAQCIVVEDSEVGIAAALAAGMRVIYYNPHQYLESFAPTLSIGSFGELLTVVDRIGT